MRKPYDTRRTPAEMRLAQAIRDPSMADMIESEERAGGQAMVEATVVPTEGSDQLEALGFRLGDVVHDDPIFREVVAPDGWKRELGDNPYGYWTYLVDPEGKRRVAMFYKAAFYDRRAHLQVLESEADLRRGL